MSDIKPIFLFVLLSSWINLALGQDKPISNDSVLTKIDSLKPAIVTSAIRPHMQGDTIEYNTDYIILHTNSVVEDLLRRLPGLQIAVNGDITYNGQKIEHLLVDGEDIFGSDPTVVTRNFDASKIARVQILDRKTEQALFTGIDDGSRTRVLNLVMKESAKNGYFGKVETGCNAGGDYNVNGAFAAFQKKEQFTALGLASNAGITGFSSNESGATATVSFLNGNTDALGAIAGKGIPKFSAVALHYANTWALPTDHLAANYQYSHYATEPITDMQSLQIQPDSVYGQSQQSKSINSQDQHWVYGDYDWGVGQRSAFKLIFHGSNSEAQNQYNATASSNFNENLVNSSLRTIQDRVSRSNLGGTLSWRTQIGTRIDRVLSANAGFSKIDNSTNGYLYSLNNFYFSNGAIESRDTVDERKVINSHSISASCSLNFTVPVWEGAVLGLSMGARKTSDAPLQTSYAPGNGKYDEIIDSLSSHFRTMTISQHATLNLQGRNGHLSYVVGTDWTDYHYRQNDLIADSTTTTHYSNWTPKVMLNFIPNPSTIFSFNYNSQTQEPTITQLTPTKNNNDPLHISLGNPDLKPGFSQNFKLDYHQFKTWIIDVEFDLSVSQNDISSKTFTDSLGRQVSQPVNVDGGRSVSINLGVSRKILGFDAGAHISATYGRTMNYVNADLTQNDAYSGGAGLTINRYVVDKYSFQLNSTYSYFDQVSSINPLAPVRYWAQSHQGSLTLFFLKDITINTNASYTWQEKTSAFSANTAVFLWNASVGRNFLHGKLVARLQFNNLLNANAGISRMNTGNINTQSSTNILGRYWMLSAIYHFDKKFKKN